MADNEQEEGPRPISKAARKESAGVTTTFTGRKESRGLPAASMAPPGRRRKPAPPPKDEDPSINNSKSSGNHNNSSQDDGNASLKAPIRVVSNPFGVEDITHKVICEGTLHINVLTKRYFVLYGSGTVYLYKSEAQKEKSSTAEQLTDRLVTITPCVQKKLKGHWVTFHFDNGSTRNYKTASQENQQEWIAAGNLVKSS